MSLLRSWCVVLPAAMFLLGASASAATYYVSNAGNDGNPGTSDAPFQHLSRAAAAAQQPGDTVLVMDGTYDNEGVVSPGFVVRLGQSGNLGNPIIFQAINRGRVILDSMNTSGGTDCNGAYSYFDLRNSSFIVIQGFVFQRSCDEGIHSNDSAHDVLVRWNEFRNIAQHTVTDQIGRDGIYLNNSEYNFTFDGNVFHDIGRTDGVSNPHFDHGIYTHGNNIAIINNVFYNMNRGFSIQMADGAANMLIANNTFVNGQANGDAGDIMFWGNNSNVTVRDNIFYAPNQTAMTQYAASIYGCSFDHNLIYAANGFMSGGGCSESNTQFGDPGFMNIAGADFHLRPGSVAVGMGVPADVWSDLDGITRPQNKAADVGAYQFSSAANLQIVNSSRGGSLLWYVGDWWTVNITGGAPNAPVVVTVGDWSGGVGTTDAAGNLQLSGQAADANLGVSHEVWTVGGVVANPGSLDIAVLP